MRFDETENYTIVDTCLITEERYNCGKGKGMFARTTCERNKEMEEKDDGKGEKREKLRKEKSRDGDAAIDLILQQETPRGKELVLLEMQPVPVGEQTPLSLSLSLTPPFPFPPFLSLSSAATVTSTPSGSHFNEFLSFLVVSGNNVQFK